MHKLFYKDVGDVSIVDKAPTKALEPSHFIDNNLPVLEKGQGVNICLVDSGCVDNMCVKVAGFANLGNSENNSDVSGHATISAGILVGTNSSGFTGLAKNAKLFCAKASDDSGKNATPTSLAASILWAVVVGANVIIVPYVLNRKDESVINAVNKAKENNVIVVFEGTDSEAIVPENAISTANLVKENELIISTYLNEEYVQVKSQDFTPAIVGGIAALLVERSLGYSQKAKTRDFVQHIQEMLRGKE